MKASSASARAQIVDEKLHLVGLDRWADSLASKLSGGMQQRVGLARAFATEADILLMDEPFEGVDAVGARLMKDILVEQVRHGATIFLTSHVLEVVERLCDRVAIINEGKLLVNESLAALRAGSETLEDIFVRMVGAERTAEALDWL